MYWVTMTDKFMSGWGLAEGKINKFVVECKTHEEATIISDHAHKRSEMRRINICANKPHYNARYLVSYRTFDQLGSVWKD